MPLMRRDYGYAMRGAPMDKRRDRSEPLLWVVVVTVVVVTVLMVWPH